MNKIIFPIFAILIAVVLAGCNSSSRTLSQPEGKIIVDDASYLMIQSNYEWKEGDIEIKTQSSPDVYELVDYFKTLEVEKGDILKFEIDKNPTSITVTKLNEDGSIDNVEIKDNKITAPSKEGYYIYELHTIWDRGKENFVFDINVK
ncbi:hypothetical protein [Psychrobacillus sp. NPDC093180]|uniref:hypothetical protein n=1 Tax=Psychrobacillus sp. NPDC093180 TaxID=3364489 RepID=UPI00382FE651